MTPTNIFGIALIVMALGLAVAASIRIEKEKPESPSQRLGQWLFVWLVPFIGPLVTIQLLRREPERRAGEYPVEHPFPDSAWSDPQARVPPTDVDTSHSERPLRVANCPSLVGQERTVDVFDLDSLPGQNPGQSDAFYPGILIKVN